MLSAAYPKKREVMAKMWLADNVAPADVYHLMPIAAEKPNTRGLEGSMEITVFEELKQWVDYIAARLKENVNHDRDVFEMLVYRRQNEELVPIFIGFEARMA